MGTNAGAMWKLTGKAGLYWGIRVNIREEDVILARKHPERGDYMFNFVAFKNVRKLKKIHPDFFLYLSTPRELMDRE